MKTNLHMLDSVTSTIVYEMGEVGVFQYNKLAYLFEYFHMKNFGCRYTGEDFIKQKHGPVITDYKKQLQRLHSANLVELNIESLMVDRKVDDCHFSKIAIRKTTQTTSSLIEEQITYTFLQSVLRRFGKLTTKQLEEFVYSTQPLLNYKGLQMRGRKKPIGSYVLDNCITLKQFDSDEIRGRRLAIEHLRKYPDVDFEQMAKDAKEFAFFEEMRPEE